MKVVYRNLLKLLSIGAFNAEDMIEPMSEFKWNQLLNLSEFNNISYFVFSGIEKISKNNSDIIPNSVITYLDSCFDPHGKDIMTKCGAVNIVSDTKEKKFSNFYLNTKFNNIIFNEIHSIDTSIDSLKFLELSIENIRHILVNDLDLRKIIELGFCLRESGDRIDFIKVESWFNKLQLVDIMNLISCYLIIILGFDKEEIPFFRSKVKSAIPNIYSFFDSNMKFIEDEEKNKRLSSQKTLRGEIRLKYFTYFPLEVSSRIFSNIIKRISDIEE